MIRVVFLSTFDNTGGASKATRKLYRALRRDNLDLKMLVKKKTSEDPGIRTVFTFLPASIHLAIDRFLLSRYKKGERSFWSLALLPNFFLSLFLRTSRFDILQLNWINAGFVPIKLLKRIKKPIVWRLSDCWPFTGGCHWYFACDRYKTGCNACPQLQSTDTFDYSHKVFSLKTKYWQETNLTLVAPSKWMQKNAENSKLFNGRRVVYIPTGIDTQIFKPLPREQTRTSLTLEKNKKYILFGAVDAISDPNKGFHLLMQALDYLYFEFANPEQIEILVFGHPPHKDADLPLKFRTRFIGNIGSPDLLNQYYAASDVFVVPSIMDNSPNTVIEAMGAGTPVVGFNACGTAELIEHLEDGYLATPYEPQDFCNGILHILNTPTLSYEMGLRARKKVVEKYNITDIANQYALLYQQIHEDYNHS